MNLFILKGEEEEEEECLPHVQDFANENQAGSNIITLHIYSQQHFRHTAV